MTLPSDNPLSYLGVQAPNPANVITANRNPNATDVSYPLGTLWVNVIANSAFILVDVSAGAASWDAFAGGSSAVDTINGLSPTGGNITLAGTANQITATSGGSTVTFSIPAAFTAPGTITAASGDITATNGDLVLAGAATQLQQEGGAATDFIGQATLVAGTVTIANTNIAANDRIFLTRSSINGSTALGTLEAVISAGSDFVINARNPADATIQTNDVSIVDYFIVRQL